MEEKFNHLNVSSINHTFDKFVKVKGTENAFKIMQDVGLCKSDRKFILLYGQAGCGKTHLIEATVIEWDKQGIYTRYNTFSELMRILKKSMRPNSIPPYDDRFKGICEWDRLIIDDVGMGTTESRWEIAELEDIINERYHHRYYSRVKTTIMATNKNISELPDRIVSRFCDPEFGAVVLIEAEDYRRRKI